MFPNGTPATPQKPASLRSLSLPFRAFEALQGHDEGRLGAGGAVGDGGEDRRVGHRRQGAHQRAACGGGRRLFFGWPAKGPRRRGRERFQIKSGEMRKKKEKNRIPLVDRILLRYSSASILWRSRALFQGIGPHFGRQGYCSFVLADLEGGWGLSFDALKGT